jgi:hypothetical protein
MLKLISGLVQLEAGKQTCKCDIAQTSIGDCPLHDWGTLIAKVYLLHQPP